MRLVLACFLLLFAVHSAPAASSRSPDLYSVDAALRWINSYRHKPEPLAVPAVIKALSGFGAFKDPESSGIYLGFFAGILAANPQRAEDIIAKTLPLNAEDQWMVVRAIAYSGHPEWKALLAQFADKMPGRRVMIDTYLNGKSPTLNHLVFEKDPSWFERMRAHLRMDKLFGRKKDEKVKLKPSPEVLDTLWGYYFATADYRPIGRIIEMLPWSKEEDDVEKLMLGAMAKFTLASNASRDPGLLALLKRGSLKQPHERLAILNEVISAAELVETTRIRREALAAIEELKRKGPGYQREVAWWGRVGEFAIAGGCLAAAVAGQVEFGLPCVVGGALTAAGLKYWSAQ